MNSPEKDGWNIGTSPEELIKTYPNLDPRVKTLFAHVSDIKMWRLFVHKAYPYWTKDVVGLLGDAAHPMLPDQAQGFGQAIEDAAALGIIFGEDYFDSDVKKGLKRYEEVRKGRATMVQDAATRARTDITERIGWKTEKQVPGKLTIEEVCGYDMVEHIKEYIANKS